MDCIIYVSLYSLAGATPVVGGGTESHPAERVTLKYNVKRTIHVYVPNEERNAQRRKKRNPLPMTAMLTPPHTFAIPAHTKGAQFYIFRFAIKNRNHCVQSSVPTAYLPSV